MSNNSIKKVRIVMSGHGKGEVFINALKVKGVTAIRFSSGVDCPNQVELTFIADQVEISGVADVTEIGSMARELKSSLRVVIPQPAGQLNCPPVETMADAAVRTYGADSPEAVYWKQCEADAVRLSAA